MFCSKCGKEVKEEWKRCPFCEGDISIANKNPVEKVPKKKHKGITIIGIVMLMIFIGCMIVFGGEKDRSEEMEQALDLVQNGYLGNYNMVSVKELLEETWIKDGEWNSLIYEDDVVVEYAGQDREKDLILFVVEENMESFQVAAMMCEGEELGEASDIKFFLDDLYEIFSKENPTRGVSVDNSLDNVTTTGTRGPIEVLNISLADYSEIDVGAYLGEKIDSEELGKLGFEYEEERLYYSSVDEQYSITINEKTAMIENVMITSYGTTSHLPQIYGVFIGMNKEIAVKLLSQIYQDVEKMDESTVAFYTSKTGDTLLVEFDMETESVTTLIYVFDEELLLSVEETEEEKDEETEKETEKETEDASDSILANVEIYSGNQEIPENVETRLATAVLGSHGNSIQFYELAENYELYSSNYAHNGTEYLYAGTVGAVESEHFYLVIYFDDGFFDTIAIIMPSETHTFKTGDTLSVLGELTEKRVDYTINILPSVIVAY